jgi:hypothetical protein
MGSVGTGRFDDYQKNNLANGGVAGESEDRCSEGFETLLEEVERCDFFQEHGQPPSIGTSVIVSLGKRITVSTNSGETIGYLPTRFNFLAACIASGFSYTGQVTLSVAQPIVKVEVSISPTEP